jgi:hypothetical protein
MSRTLLGFLCKLWALDLLRVAAIAPLVATSLIAKQPSLSLLACVLVGLLVVRAFHGWLVWGEWRPNLWLWRFSCRILRFEAVPGELVSFVFQRGLDQRLDLYELRRWAELDLDEFSNRFGTKLRRRLTVVLVGSHREISADFNQPMGGCMIVHASAIVLAADCPLREGLRHELAHLFGARWNLYPPSLIEEGLAMWLQSPEPERLKDFLGAHFAIALDIDPARLLNRAYFLAPERLHFSYALAGAFTAFLIRRFGWAAYGRFYRKADRWAFRSRFARVFGMSFEEAWRICRDESLRGVEDALI